MVERTYKYRIYPSEKQIKNFEQIADTTRALYNMMLADRTQQYRKTGTWKKLDPEPFVKGSLLMKELAPSIINRTVTSLERTYINFFNYRNSRLDRYRQEALEKAKANSGYQLTDADLVGYPKPKQKTGRESWETGTAGVQFTAGRINIPGMGKIKIRLHRPIPCQAKISHFTLLKKASGDFYLLVHLQLPDVPVKTQPETAVGVALEPGRPVQCSDGIPIRFQHQSPLQTQRMALAYEKLTVKKPGSRRYEKQRLHLASLYEKRFNQRRDELHKAAGKIVAKADVIVIEEPAVMKKKDRLTRAGDFEKVSDEAWWTFSEYLRYKSQDAGKRFWRAPMALPIRDACSGCGVIIKDRPREGLWRCPYCGLTLPAALNAARNLEAMAIERSKEK